MLVRGTRARAVTLRTHSASLRSCTRQLLRPWQQPPDRSSKTTGTHYAAGLLESGNPNDVPPEYAGA